MGQWFLMDELRLIEAGVGGLSAKTVRGRKPSNERHRDVLERVLADNTAAPAPLTWTYIQA